MKGFHRQSGIAIITALLVVVVAAGIAAAMIAEQSQALTRTGRATARAQATALAGPVLDFARDSMRQSFKPGKPVDFTQSWARGMQALPVEGGSASGRLVDQGGLFNLNNLARDGKKSADDVDVFRRLLSDLKLNPDLANAAADWIDSDDETSLPGGQENALYFAGDKPRRAANRDIMHPTELLRAKGFDEAALQRLAPFVTALPERSKININTAPEEIIRAALPELSADDRTTLLRLRQGTPFAAVTGANSLQARFKGLQDASLARLEVTSGFFLVQLAIDLQGAQLAQSALLQRTAKAGAEGWPAIIWTRNSL
jgi:general secretion pathway protein K